MEISKIFLSEITRPRAFIFGMKHHLGDLCQVCSNHDFRGQTGPAPGVNRFYLEFIQEKLQKSSSPEPQSLELRYFACSITQQTLIKFAQIMIPRVKTAPPRGSIDSTQNLYRKNFKNLLLQNHKAWSLDILHVA